MKIMTVNQQKALFQSLADNHDQVKDFAFGDIRLVEEKMNKEAEYHMVFVIPVQTVKGQQATDRTYMIMVMDIPKKDRSNDVEVWSDTEQILDDYIIALRRTSKDYQLIGEPTMFPFQEEHSDWVTGYRAEVTLRTLTRSNNCDLPMSDFSYPGKQRLTTVIIEDQNGNTIATVNGGGRYRVTILTGINDTLDANVTTIVDDIL